MLGGKIDSPGTYLYSFCFSGYDITLYCSKSTSFPAKEVFKLLLKTLELSHYFFGPLVFLVYNWAMKFAISHDSVYKFSSQNVARALPKRVVDYFTSYIAADVVPMSHFQ